MTERYTQGVSEEDETIPAQLGEVDTTDDTDDGADLPLSERPKWASSPGKLAPHPDVAAASSDVRESLLSGMYEGRRDFERSHAADVTTGAISLVGDRERGVAPVEDPDEIHTAPSMRAVPRSKDPIPPTVPKGQRHYLGRPLVFPSEQHPTKVLDALLGGKKGE